MRENRTCGSEGGEGNALPDPYHVFGDDICGGMAFLACHDQACELPSMRGGWVYIMTNQPNGTLYVGVTADLARRVSEHRDGAADGFTKRYGLNRLVYVEHHDAIDAAIQREKNMKHWPRAWKVRIINADNPEWDDLFDRIV